jgi:hypothetical protein
MSLSVTRAKVKAMCGIDDSDYDSAIDTLIADIVPVIEFSLKPEHIAATGDTGLQATLNLAAAEIVSGEFVAQISRKPGAADAIQIGDVKISPYLAEVNDPSGLKAQGEARLRPFLRIDPVLPARAPIGAATGKRDREES